MSRRSSHPHWPFNISNDDAARYQHAAAELYRSWLGRSEKRFHEALVIALRDCERARAYSWLEHEKQNTKSIASTWDSANAAAIKLAIHFQKYPAQLGAARLLLANKESGLTFKKKPPQLSHPQAFASFLRALAKQRHVRRQQRLPHVARRYGALQISNAPVSEKLPKKQVVLAITLAFRFCECLKADPVNSVDNSLRFRNHEHGLYECRRSFRLCRAWRAAQGNV